jgi:hypothetical protein
MIGKLQEVMTKNCPTACLTEGEHWPKEPEESLYNRTKSHYTVPLYSYEGDDHHIHMERF